MLAEPLIPVKCDVASNFQWWGNFVRFLACDSNLRIPFNAVNRQDKIYESFSPLCTSIAIDKICILHEFNLFLCWLWFLIFKNKFKTYILKHSFYRQNNIQAALLIRYKMKISLLKMFISAFKWFHWQICYFLFQSSYLNQKSRFAFHLSRKRLSVSKFVDIPWYLGNFYLSDVELKPSMN